MDWCPHPSIESLAQLQEVAISGSIFLLVGIFLVLGFWHGSEKTPPKRAVTLKTMEVFLSLQAGASANTYF